MTENYRSVFDIIGPIMIGPSSSHTAGAVAIGRVARQVLGQTPVRVTVHYYESFAQTHQGHGTDYAIVAGLLQMDPADPRVPNSRELASQAGIEINFVEEPGASPIGHPNTAVLDLVGATKQARLAGCSVGGGIIEVRELVLEGVAIQPSGPLPIVLFQAPVADQAKQEQGRLLMTWSGRRPLLSNRPLPARTVRFGPLTSRTTCKTTCGPIYCKPTRASFV